MLPPPPTPVSAAVPSRRQARPRKSAGDPTNGLRKAWRTGRADAALRTELGDALAKGEHQVIVAKFPGFRADKLLGKQPIESLWTAVPTKFGELPASISLQFVLRPRKDDVALEDTPENTSSDDSDTNLQAGPTRWHFMIRARELSRTSMGGDDEEDVHWAARLVMSTSSQSQESVVAAVNDHRSIWPDCREVHTEHALCVDDEVLQQLHARGQLAWNVAVSVRDAGAPVEGSGRDFGDCC